MDLEASIAERLEKLRQWQIEQQERLLEQQRIQREILSHEQDRIYKVLRLSLDSDVNHIVEDTKNGCSSREIMTNTTEQAICDNAMLQYNWNDTLKINKKNLLGGDDDELHEYCIEEENPISVVVEKNTNFQLENSNVLSQNIKLSSDMLIEGVKPLPLDNVISNKSTVSIDDIPVPSSKKDFQTLLEERLEKESKVASKAATKSKNEKRPFLKKGQGLSRFKGSSLNPVVKETNVVSSSHNTQCIDKIDTNNKRIAHINAENIESNTSVINTPIAVKTAQKFSLKAASLPRKIICSKSGSLTPTKSTAAVNAISDRLKCLSDFDSKTERELEEMRIFELLEEKAENSSFCSTSSTVIAFLQQSTPFKIKKNLNCIGSDTMINTKPHIRMNDALEQNSIIEQFTNSEDSRQMIQYPSNQFDTNNVSHNNVADINCDTALTSNTIVEDIRKCSTDEISQNKEAYIDYLEDDEIQNVTSSATDIVEEDMHGNHSGLMCDNGVDVNHRVRFSEHNEYRIIDLTDMVNASAKRSTSINHHLEQEDWSDCSASETRSYGIDGLSLDCNEAQICCSPQAISNEKVFNASMQLPLPQHNILTKDYGIIKSDVTISNEEDKNEYGQSLFNNENNNKCSISPINEKIPQIDKNYSQRSVLLNQPSLIDTHQVCSKMYAKEEDEEEEDEEEAEEEEDGGEAEEEETEEEEAELKEEEKEIEEEDEEEEEYTQRNKIGKIIRIDKNAEKYQHYVSSEDKENWKMRNFESDILKTRLLELEKEIDIFRKESSILLFQRQKLQEDRTLLHKKYTEKERSLEESKTRIQNQLQEEKKRLIREKMAMENRIRDAQEKVRQNKLEKQKMQDLQEQLEKLRDELNIKESRWSAAESRYKSELRALRVEISKLKQEIANTHDLKKTTNIRNIKRMNGQINTKTVNQIKTSPNKRNIAILSKKTSTKALQNLSDMHVNDKCDNGNHEDIKDNDDDKENDKNDDQDKLIEPIVNEVNMDDDLKKDKSEQVAMKLHPKRDQGYAEENIAVKKRDLYENLLRDATSDLIQDQQCSSAIMQSISSRYNNAIITQMRDSKTKSNAVSPKNNDNPDTINENLENITEVFTEDNSEYYTDRLCKTSDDDQSKNVSMLIISQDREFPQEKTNFMSHTSYQNGRECAKNVVQQIQHSDGRMEYLYPNGNVKKVFPDQGLTKMIYYNGDVRETDKSGKVKYFYATTRTWHTTTLDGIEILEFPDGQVEKHSSDGTIEVSFPDGVLRIAQADGTEKWVLPDGTVAQTFVNGDKILNLPNGQKEIHTKEHKRREYPDGTVKLVYADGTQETRYSSGRKRLKDKDGNLIMDFYEN